ncbi:hypothetical protein AA12717_1560 [Gluconacetobacter sacchari DSM 12717]|nr:hypothetical protein AA12717_1560 [Gluconacetobacter sacchari DSM 12717]
MLAFLGVAYADTPLSTARKNRETVLWRFFDPVIVDNTIAPFVTSGDVMESYSIDALTYARRWNHGLSEAPIMRLALDNWATDWHTDYKGPEGSTGLEVSAYAHSGSNGNTVGTHVNLYSYGTNNGAALDQGYAVGVVKGGTNGVWGFAGQITDTTHAQPVGETWGMEFDIMANGDDLPVSQYDVSRSNRVFYFLSAKTLTVPAWSAFTSYSASDAISASFRGECGIFKAIVPGRSGASAPPWDSNDVVIDNSVTWSFSEMCQNVVGAGFEFTTDSNSRFNTGIGSSRVTYDNAFIDLALARNNMNVAAGAMIRFPLDGIMDWSADGTAEGKNRHIMFYDRKAGFLYVANNAVRMAIHDDGSIVLPGSVHTGSLVLKGTMQLQPLSRTAILGITTAKEGMMLNDSTDHVPVIYEHGHWYPLKLGHEIAN